MVLTLAFLIGLGGTPPDSSVSDERPQPPVPSDQNTAKAREDQSAGDSKIETFLARTGGKADPPRVTIRAESRVDAESRVRADSNIHVDSPLWADSDVNVHSRVGAPSRVHVDTGRTRRPPGEQTVHVSGVGYPRPDLSGPQARLMARRAAEIDALRNLAARLGYPPHARLTGYRFHPPVYRPDGGVEITVERLAPPRPLLPDPPTSPARRPSMDSSATPSQRSSIDPSMSPPAAIPPPMKDAWAGATTAPAPSPPTLLSDPPHRTSWEWRRVTRRRVFVSSPVHAPGSYFNPL